MGQQILLSGSSRAFTGKFKGILEQCSYEPVIRKKGARPPRGRFVHIFEVVKKAELKELALRRSKAPYLIFTKLKTKGEDMAGLKGKGLVGVVTGSTSPEDLSFLIDRARFHGNMIRKNKRARVNIPVSIKTVKKSIKTFASILSKDGMFVVTINPLPVNSAGTIDFKIPGARKVMNTRIRVLYNISINKDLNIIASPSDPFKRVIAHPGMAIFFTDLAEKDREFIDTYVVKEQ